jgi:arginine:ornithine antiporter/lysine permease
MILVPYLFSAIYGLKVALAQSNRVLAAIKTVVSSRADVPVATLASVYCLWLLYAAGLKYLMLSALLYAPGAAFYFWAKHQRNETAFTKTEWVILAALLALAITAIFMLTSQKITL